MARRHFGFLPRPGTFHHRLPFSPLRYTPFVSVLHALACLIWSAAIPSLLCLFLPRPPSQSAIVISTARYTPFVSVHRRRLFRVDDHGERRSLQVAVGKVARLDEARREVHGAAAGVRLRHFLAEDPRVLVRDGIDEPLELSVGAGGPLLAEETASHAG